ncbi:MAG: hypothetical protein IPK24_05615 [Kineosporiaceae bacterium]|nr:hypothetical protein [Kineosporiaceae bacterium]
MEVRVEQRGAWLQQVCASDEGAILGAIDVDLGEHELVGSATDERSGQPIGVVDVREQSEGAHQILLDVLVHDDRGLQDPLGLA